MKQVSFISYSSLDQKIETAIERIKCFENKAIEYNPAGYYLAYSGGKDSDVILKLTELSGVKFHAHYNLTTVDPPELVRRVKMDKRINIEKPKYTMWQLIKKKKYPPTRIARYCCEYLKEKGGNGQFVITGIRWQESPKRKNRRASIELNAMKSYVNLINDNTKGRRMIENCKMRSKHILNPIIEWSTNDIWEFIKKYKIDYCKIYDEGFTRLGCIGCPLAGHFNMKREFKRYPKYKEMYIRAFDEMIKLRVEKGLKTDWKNGQEVFDWWITPTKQKNIIMKNQINFFEGVDVNGK